MKTPLVSIITPSYNSEKYLSQTIDSVLSQTYTNWEHIIIDDKSNDNSIKIIKEYKKKESRIKLIKLRKNQGSGIARNKGIKQAKGKFIAFLDSDDIWDKNKLSLQIEFMLKYNIEFSHTDYGYIDEKSNKIKDIFKVSKVVNYKNLLMRTEISCLTAIFDAEAIGKYYMSDHRRKQDYALWLSILKDGYCSYGLNDCLAYYRQHSDSGTSKKYKLIVSHYAFLRETQKLSRISSIYYTLHYLWNGVIKYYIK